MSGHEAEVVPDQDLVELFRARRPDADAFRREVDRRIREKTAHPELAIPDPNREPNSFRAEFVRRAAALIGFDPTGTSVGVGGSLKFVTAALALPFLVLVASVGAFVAGLRSVRRSAERAHAAPIETRASAPTGTSYVLGSSLARSMQLLGVLAISVMVLVGVEWAIELLLALFLLSTMALVLVVRGLSESAQLTQPKVERFAVMILSGLLLGVFLWAGQFHLSDSTSELGLGWAAGIVALGLFALPFASGRRWTRGDAWRTLGLLVFVALLNPIGVTRSLAESVRHQLEVVQLDATDLANWRAAARANTALESAQVDLPDMSRVQREMDRVLAEDIDAHPAVWTSAERMGAVRDDQWQQLASRKMEAYRLDQLMKQSGPFNEPDYNSYLVPMWLATRAPTAEQIDALADRLEASWPVANRHDPLDQVVMIVGILDELGLRERADALRPAVHELMRKSWVAASDSKFARIGGFTSDPVKLQTSFVSVTANAVGLMERFGVPDGIDLRRVRGNLRGESRAYSLVFEIAPRLKLEARAALLQLEEGIGVPQRSWFEAVLGERMTIAALLTVLLCMFAIRRALPDGTESVRGAMP